MVYQRLVLLDVVDLVTSTRLEKWTNGNLTKSNKGKWCRNNPMYKLGWWKTDGKTAL